MMIWDTNNNTRTHTHTHTNRAEEPMVGFATKDVKYIDFWGQDFG